MLTMLDVWKMSSAFQTARIILSATELKIFENLNGGSKNSKQMSRSCKSSLRGMEYILDALSALGVLQKKDGRYSLPAHLKNALTPKSEETILPILQHSSRMWQKWHCLTRVVKTGRPADCITGISSYTKEDTKAFIGAMHSIGRGIAGDIVKDCRVAKKSKKLLDIGGASGTYTMAFLKEYPNLTATIFDLSDVIPMARERIGKTKVAKRVKFYAGDFDCDALPKGHDLALLSAIIHQNSRKENRALYKKIFKALDDGGTLLIRDHVMNSDRTKPMLGATFAINMLVATNGGGTFTFKEIKEDLSFAGFSKVKLIRKGDYMDCVVSAEKN